MNRKTKNLTLAALIAAIYVALCYMQNLLLPGSASNAIQFRVAEAMMVLCLFTPAAIPGLTLGCLLFNVSFAGALPMDMVVGTAATAVAGGCMYALRNLKCKGLPVPALLMPAVWNGLLVGWELSFYVGGAFLLNCLYVAVGELAVLLSLGSGLYWVFKKRGLDTRLF